MVAVVGTYRSFDISALVDLEVLQWDDTPRLLFRWRLEVVETVIGQDEPSSLPVFVLTT